MANANLSITQELKDRFLAVQEDRSVRWIGVTIQGEDIVLKGDGKASPSVEEDFNSLNEHVESNVALFMIFCEDGEANADSARHWVLISWVPDLCRPRDKMLFSSSRDNLKRSLGHGYFSHEYYVNDAADLTWSAYQESIASHGAAPLSEAEKLVKEEAKLERDTSIRSNAMGEIPFKTLSDADAALSSFQAQTINFATLSLSGEDIACKLSGTVDVAAGGLSGSLVESCTNPAFILLRLVSGVVLFVYFCPDESKVRDRMVYSTAKATVLSAIATNGVNVDKIMEVRASDELDTVAVDAEQSAEATQAPMVDANVKKPARPGRGKRAAPKKKFIPDSE